MRPPVVVLEYLNAAGQLLTWTFRTTEEADFVRQFLKREYNAEDRQFWIYDDPQVQAQITRINQKVRL